MSDPLDVIRLVAGEHTWQLSEYEHPELPGISLLVNAKWQEYSVYCEWDSVADMLLIGCFFELRVPERRLGDIELLAKMVSSRILLGSFEVDREQGCISVALSIEPASAVTPAVVTRSVTDLVKVIDWAYPAFMRLFWAMLTPQEAFDELPHEGSGTG